MTPVRPPAIPPLTSLRFFAAALVVAFHYDPNRFTALPGFFQSWLETGYEAVTFFFILSGFILSYVYADADFSRRANLRAFFIARFGRLAPAYFLALLVALPLFAINALDEDAGPLRDTIAHGVLVLTALQSWWPPAAVAWNPPAWSMSVEWFLYAAFPLALFLSRRIPAAALLPGSLALVAAVSAFRLVVMDPLAAENPGAWGNLAAFFPLFHLPQFLFGVALGRVHLHGPKVAPALAAGLFAAGAVGLMILFLDRDALPAHVRSNAVLVIFFGLLIFGAAQDGHFAYRMLSARPLVFLGQASYAIYALHEPVALWWDEIGPAVHGVKLPPALDFLLYGAILVGAAALCYRYLETPLRRRIRRWGTPAAARPIHAAEAPPA